MGKPTLREIFDDSISWSTIGIQLRNCPKGINNINISLMPTASSPALDEQAGVIRSNPSSTAKGVAVQIQKRGNGNFDFTKKYAVEYFSPGSEGVWIELQAKYVQRGLGSNMRAGTANAEIMYVLEYL
ncbi:fimbrial protein [Pseudomonas sp. B21-051]|nr:fimbrial protein [Pseudomonas sp. B21-051]